jgi:hypothetical protein
MTFCDCQNCALLVFLHNKCNNSIFETMMTGHKLVLHQATNKTCLLVTKSIISAKKKLDLTTPLATARHVS